jgi:hypothetical protein
VEIGENNKVEEAAEYTLTTNTCVKNKIPNQFAEVSLKGQG